jgi:GNAT superfamily N-acetyltransferase
MLKFLELKNLDSIYFNTVIEYYRKIFNYSIKEINSLVSKLQAGENEQVRAHIIYADCQGELAGFAIFYYFPKNQVGFIEALVVLEDYRNRGIGSQLYRHMMDLLKEYYPKCAGHVLEICRQKENYQKRKSFFLKQGCIPIALDFFSLDPVVSKSGINILYHPYRLNQTYSLKTMEDIFREMAINLVHTITVPIRFRPRSRKRLG